MNIFSTMSDKLKETSTAIGSIFAIIASVSGGIIYLETNYANAADVKDIVKSQNEQLKALRQSQSQNSLFQLEYYDNSIKRLELERNRSEQLLTDPKTTNAQRAYTRNPNDVQREIDDLNMRREIIKRGLIELK